MATPPTPEEKQGKRGFTIPPYFPTSFQPYQQLAWTEQQVWRNVVQKQPVAVLCREAITERISTIDWRIEPADPVQRQELSAKIKKYTDLFEQNNGMDYVEFTEWVLGDALDLPFGAACELIYRGDDPNKQLVDYVPLDGATFFPTNNRDFPAVQRVPGLDPTQVIVFPAHAINRLYYTPRREIEWRGWGMPPPEKIYLAIQMLVEGDNYYWKLLVDTPEAGILDLLDMSKDSAMEWLTSLRVLMGGQDPMKVPVLYEHNTPAQFIPFGRPPSDIMYDSTIHKYAAITCAGYGLSLSDIGVQVVSSGGETLAGSIRQERNTVRKGIGFAKMKVRLFRNRMLPPDLKFTWVDPDEEQQVARGRALLSQSAAYSSMIDKRIISPKEARQNLINSGVIAVALPEDIPEEDMKLFDDLTGGEQKRENMLTATQPPSAGGQGEVRASTVSDTVEKAFSAFVEKNLTAESLMLDEAEFIENGINWGEVFNDTEIIPLLVDYYGMLHSETRKSKGFVGRLFDRYNRQEVFEQITIATNEFSKEIANLMLIAKSHALDNSDQVSDNLEDVQVMAVNRMVEVLADKLEKYVRI